MHLAMRQIGKTEAMTSVKVISLELLLAWFSLLLIIVVLVGRYGRFLLQGKAETATAPPRVREKRKLSILFYQMPVLKNSETALYEIDCRREIKPEVPVSRKHYAMALQKSKHDFAG